MSVIAVVGAGVMGVDVASILSFHGYKVIVKDIDRCDVFAANTTKNRTQ